MKKMKPIKVWAIKEPLSNRGTSQILLWTTSWYRYSAWAELYDNWGYAKEFATKQDFIRQMKATGYRCVHVEIREVEK